MSCEVRDGLPEVIRGQTGRGNVVRGQGRIAGGHTRSNREGKCRARSGTECQRSYTTGDGAPIMQIALDSLDVVCSTSDLTKEAH